MRIRVQLAVVLLCSLWSGSVAAQAPPTRQGAGSTPAQEEQIRQGAALHDQGKLGEAIALYEAVLKDNPNNTMAMYELAYSLLEQKEYARALALAARGTTYRSEQLPLFYDLMGSAHDLMGDPKKAIEVYSQGIAVVPGASMLYYNRGITEMESLKDPVAARRSFERAIAVEPLQPAAHLMLGQVLQSNGYSVPSFFPFAVSLMLEPGGPQALRAYGFMRTVLRGGLSNDPQQNQMMTGGGMRTPGSSPMPGIAMPGTAAGAAPSGSAPVQGRGAAPSKTDEGDFRAIEAGLAASHQKLLAQIDEQTPELQALREQVDAFLTQVAARDRSAETSFVGRYYVPFFAELKARGFVEPFLNWSIQRAPVQGARQWVQGNQPKVKEFLDWAQAYKWPTP